MPFHFGGAHVPRRKYRRTPAEHCRGRCPHRPAVRPECFFQLRRGRRPRRPAIGETAPTFQSISGSGAEGETILNLGYGLPNPPLADRKRKSRNLGFLRAFGHFTRAGKVTRRRQNRPIQLPIPPKNGPMWASAPTARKRELFSNNTADPMCPAAVGRKAPSNLCRGRCPHRPAGGWTRRSARRCHAEGSYSPAFKIRTARPSISMTPSSFMRESSRLSAERFTFRYCASSFWPKGMMRMPFGAGVRPLK